MAGYNRKEKKYNNEHNEEAAPDQPFRHRSKSGHHQLPFPFPDSAIAAISSWAEAEPGNSLIKEPLFITRYRSQTLHQFLEFGGYQQHTASLVSEIDNQSHNFALSADVESPRGFIEKK